MTHLEAVAAAAREQEARVFRDEPMCRHTTFKVGGAAELFIEPGSMPALIAVIRSCEENGVHYFILGNGSNILVPDEGIRGAVIHMGKFSGIHVSGNEMECGAGAQLSSVCLAARDSGLSGLEFAFGIPGSVGGAVYMNAGAYGGEMKDVVARASHIENGRLRTFSLEELAFGYRKSAYSSGGRVVASVSFRLRRGDKEEIQRKMSELLHRRQEKQPLEYPSAGSVFKRPEGYYAGTLIDQCGLKGLTVGGAQVSTKHAGFIINTGGATCCDILKLIELVTTQVYQKTGIVLEREIRLVG